MSRLGSRLDDTSKTRTKSAASQARESASVPLRAWPNQGICTIPEIFGLDKYQYDVGTRMYARAEAKFSEGLADEVQRERRRDVPGGAVHESLCDATVHGQEPLGAREICVQAGRKGNAVILWNRTGQSHDGGRVQLRKRRQKLTNDLLKEIVVSYGETFQVISSWFSVFEFYCERPDDAAMPPLRQAHDGDLEDDDDEQEAPLRRNRRATRASTGSLFGALRPRADSTTLHRGPKSDIRPKLRELPPHKSGVSAYDSGIPHAAHATMANLARLQGFMPNERSGWERGLPPAPKSELDSILWHRRCKELSKFKCPAHHGRNICVGDLNLEKRCKAEYLDSEKFENWLQGYDAAAANPVDSSERKVMQRPGSMPSLLEADEKAGCTQLQANVQVMKQSFLGLTDNDVQDSRCDVSARSDRDNGSAAVSSTASEAGEEACTAADSTSRELMVRTVSKALLKSKLLQKGVTGSQHKSKHKNADVLAERARILAGILPVQMTSDNLFRSLSLFGVSRQKVGTRIYDILMHCCPCLTQLNSSDGLSFEVFFQLLCPLLAGKFKSALSRPKLSTSGGVHDRPSPWAAALIIDESEWTGSDLLLRLIFSLLTDRVSVRDEHAGKRREADQVGITFSRRVLSESLQLFLSAQVLLEMDRGPTNHGSEHLSSSANEHLDAGEQQGEEDWASLVYDPSSSSATGSINLRAGSKVGSMGLGLHHRQSVDGSKLLGNLSEHRTVFNSFVECLHWDLLQCQTEVSAGLDECVNTTPQTVLSFSAFECWVSRNPSVFKSLLHLLFPLLPYGVALTHEEMELSARGLSQRCGELRARMDVRAQGFQKKRFVQLHVNFTKPRRDHF